MMSERYVTVRTGARLHFGPLSYQPQQGRHFGGIGMMIDQPGVQLTARVARAEEPSQSNSSRAAGILETLRQQNSLMREPVKVEVSEEIPPHCGLGSGTQLALALTDAVAALQQQRYSAAQLARLSGRGERSAIGLIGYEQGGFLVDAGRQSAVDCGVLAARVAFPDDWRILLVRGNADHGFSGEVEMAAFQKLKPMSELVSGRLCRLALTEILPALQTRDFSSFTAAVHEFGAVVGHFFAETQNGIFSTEVIRSLADRLPAGALGMAQSSWGPTAATFAENEAAAEELRHRIQSDPAGPRLTIQIVKPRNTGRELTLTE